MGEGPTAVVVMCPLCSERYGKVIEPGCPICRGAGVLWTPTRGNPQVAARALVMALAEYEWPGKGGTIVRREWGQAGHEEARRRAAKAGLIIHPQAEATPPGPAPTSMEDRQRIGRAAGKLLVEVGLRQRKVRAPVRRTKTEIAEAKRQKEAAEASWKVTREELRRERQQREAEARAKAMLAERHPEEFAELAEGEAVMGALGALPNVSVRGCNPL